MLRTCTEINIKKYFEEETIVQIYIDDKNQKEIMEFIKRKNNLNKTRRIFYEMLKNRYNNELYRKEKVTSKAFNITAMKYTSKGKRIYCKEYIKPDKKIIVIMALYNKKEFDKKTKKFIENLTEYEYGFE